MNISTDDIFYSTNNDGLNDKQNPNDTQDLNDNVIPIPDNMVDQNAASANVYHSSIDLTNPKGKKRLDITNKTPNEV